MIYQFLENCTCAGVTNVLGHGADCKLYSGYPVQSLNSLWCYAETTTCRDATTIVDFHKQLYPQKGRFGPSKRACSIQETIYKQLFGMISNNITIFIISKT